MATVAAGVPGVADFTAEDLHELQRRKAKSSARPISYEQRNVLKRKCCASESLIATTTRSIRQLIRDVGDIVKGVSSTNNDNPSWLQYALWGHCSKERDVVSGRSRLARMKQVSRESVDGFWERHKSYRQKRG